MGDFRQCRRKDPEGEGSAFKPYVATRSVLLIKEILFIGEEFLSCHFR